MPLTEAQKRKIVEEAVQKAEADDRRAAKLRAKYDAAKKRKAGWYWADFDNCGYSGRGLWEYCPPEDDFEDLTEPDEDEEYGSWRHPGCEYPPSRKPKWIGPFVAPPHK